MNRQSNRTHHHRGVPSSHQLPHLVKLVSHLTLGGIIAGAIALMAEPLRAQDINLSPKFTPDPLTYSGTTTTKFDCNKAPESLSPSHSVKVSSYFGLLRLQIESSQPVSVRIAGPDTNYCKDGSKLVLSGEWIKGDYRIWVGTPQGTPVNYKLLWSETR
ncbi:MAG: hypothetical protein WCO45_09955 [Pseudanabaena sp. ELA607]|jgi:hypothetical protein